MNILIAITIDTEIDKSVSWKISSNKSFLSVLDGIPNKLTPLFIHFGAKPTYLLSSEIIENDDCVNILTRIKDCELGTHLHGELLEPQRKAFGLDATNEMQCGYSREMEYQKLKNLTNLFKDKFHYQPTSFRAGRFGAGNNTVSLLEELGYLVDSSVTPGVDWNYREGRANFLWAREQPYFPDKNKLIELGDSKVLEVPVSIIPSRFRRYSSYLNNTGMPLLIKNIVNKMLPTTWLRPSFQNSYEMLYVIKKLIKWYHTKDTMDTIVLNMMFHSMEIIPNASPYTKTEEECKHFLDKMEIVFKFCLASNIKFVKLSELYPIFLNNGER
jgi:hypothetical protein